MSGYRFEFPLLIDGPHAGERVTVPPRERVYLARDDEDGRVTAYHRTQFGFNGGHRVVDYWTVAPSEPGRALLAFDALLEAAELGLFLVSEANRDYPQGKPPAVPREDAHATHVMIAASERGLAGRM